MTLTKRAFDHNSSAFVAELHQAAAARRLHNDHAGAFEIERVITSAGSLENNWSVAIAKRFFHIAAAEVMGN